MLGYNAWQIYTLFLRICMSSLPSHRITHYFWLQMILACKNRQGCWYLYDLTTDVSYFILQMHLRFFPLGFHFFLYRCVQHIVCKTVCRTQRPAPQQFIESQRTCNRVHLASSSSTALLGCPIWQPSLQSSVHLYVPMNFINDELLFIKHFNWSFGWYVLWKSNLTL